MKTRVTLILTVVLILAFGSYSQSAEPLKKGDAIPDFTISTIKGQTVKYEYFKDRMPLIIDLWATWCGPCNMEMPELQKIYDKYAGQFEILAVSLDEAKDLETVKKYVEKNKLTFYVAHDADKKFIEKFPTDRIPRLIIVGMEGTVLEIIEGYDEKLEGKLVRVLDLKEPSAASDYVERGYILYDWRNDLDKALADFEKALSLDSTNSQAFCGRGEIYLDKGEREKAIADLDKAIQLDPKNVRAWFNRGSAEEKLRKYDKALEIYNKGLENNPDDEYLLSFKERLENKLAVIGKPAPDITVTTLNGEKITLSDYKGKKAVIIDLWATWCGPCRMEMPKLQEFYDKHSDKVEIIAISAEKDGEIKIPEFINKNGFTFKVVYDKDKSAYGKFPTKGIPFLTIIGKDGIIIDTFTGYDPNIIKELEELLNL